MRQELTVAVKHNNLGPDLMFVACTLLLFLEALFRGEVTLCQMCLIDYSFVDTVVALFEYVNPDNT